MRNVEDRRRVIRDLKKAIRRKEIENQRMDIDLEEMAIKVAERQNVSNPNGKFDLKNKPSIDYEFPFDFSSYSCLSLESVVF